MKIQYGDETLSFDPDDVNVFAARQIRSHTGKGLVSFEQGYMDGDPDCLQALLWLIHYQAGDHGTPISDIIIDRLPVFYKAFMFAFYDEVQSRTEAAKSAEGGRPKGRTPRRTRTSGGTGTATSSS